MSEYSAISWEPGVPLSYVAEVAQALAVVDDETMTRFGELGVYVWIYRRMPWTESDEPPRGYPDGSSWESCSGGYRPDSCCVTLAHEFRQESGEWAVEDRPRWVLLHELGHAHDHLSSPRPSQDPEFRTIYLRERRAVLDDAATDMDVLGYFVRHWSPGAIEVYAECWAALHTEIADDATFRAAFPRSLEWVRDHMGAPR